MENQENYYREDEIDLRDYINVIVKRKKVIIAIFLIAVFIAGILSYFVLPKAYEASSLIEIGKIKGGLIESPTDIITTFEREATLQELGQKLGLDPEKEKISKEIVKIEIPEKTNFLEISAQADSPQKSYNIVMATIELLKERHQEKFEKAEQILEQEIEIIKKDQEKITEDIKRIEEIEIPAVEKEISRLEKDIIFYEKEIAQRSNITSEGQGRIVESYINLLAGVKNQKDSKENKITNLEDQIRSLNQDLTHPDTSLRKKEYEKAYQTTMTEIEAEPVIPDNPISPNKKMNIAIAGILGIFVGVLYAFGVEYFSRGKQI